MHLNKINGKVYIGQTKKSYRARWRSGKGYGECSRFAKAIEKYGWDEGFEHIPLIEGLTKSEADYFERFFIEFFDSQNPEFGYNLTAGGDENPMNDPVVKAKHDESIKKRSVDPEWQKKNREANRKKAQDPEWQKKVREANRKNAQDPEWQKKVREGAKKRSANPEWGENVRKANQKKSADPKWRENVRKGVKKRYADPEYQKKHREAIKKRSADPEWQKKVREANRKKAQDPEWQKKVREANRKKAQDPEWQKKVRESAKKRCKKVLCVETKIVYDSLIEAAIAVNLKTHVSIGMCCRGKYKTAGGYHWEYA